VIPQVVGELDFTPVEAELESALSQALQNRPELLYLDVMRKAREAGVRIARSNYLPNLSVFGGYEWVKDGMSDRVADSNDGWRVGIQSSWAIFDGRATEGRVIQARSQVRQVELQLADQRVAVELEVRRAISSLQEALELTESAGKVVDQAEEALRLADARYNAGSATQLDVLQTRVALTQARTNQHEANYSYLMAESALRKALGETR
ncbi:MAG TPA: TolC family protein, partial [Opitutales bacterium]|nr:TolC family protein [Opitutales bacterium]